MLRATLMSLVLVACGGGSSSTPATGTTTPAQPAASADPTCPVSVAGTSVTVEDTATGAAFVFVTTSDVAELRKRVAAVAAEHNQRHGAMGPLPDGTDAGGGGHDHHAGHGGGGEHAGHGGGGEHAGHGGDHASHGGAGGGGLAAMIGLHSKAVASDIDGGARLEFVAFANDVGKMQSELRMHAQHLSAGSCGMDHH